MNHYPVRRAAIRPTPPLPVDPSGRARSSFITLSGFFSRCAPLDGTTAPPKTRIPVPPAMAKTLRKANDEQRARASIFGARRQEEVA